MSTKKTRQARLLEIIRGCRITTQGQLVEQLRQHGVDCTQASVSRDIRELCLVKREGCYAQPQMAPTAADVPDLQELAAQISGFLQRVITVGDHLVVIHTISGTANTVAVYLDSRGWPGLVGTVAGDDTIFAAVEDRSAGESLAALINQLRQAKEASA